MKSTVSCIKISRHWPESKAYLLAIGFKDGLLLVYDILTNKIVLSTKEINQSIAEIQFAYEAECLFLMTFDQNLYKFDLKSQKVTKIRFFLKNAIFFIFLKISKKSHFFRFSQFS